MILKLARCIKIALISVIKNSVVTNESILTEFSHYGGDGKD
nr:MAG TPA: hypothetical protein [Caudoviricetes sp.]DAR72103.1 MAG TPA: hypothetical protein [Caudoviricetes sp.]